MPTRLHARLISGFLFNNTYQIPNLPASLKFEISCLDEHVHLFKATFRDTAKNFGRHGHHSHISGLLPLSPLLSILQNTGKAKAFGALPAVTALTLISYFFYSSSAVISHHVRWGYIKNWKWHNWWTDKYIWDMVHIIILLAFFLLWNSSIID